MITLLYYYIFVIINPITNIISLCTLDFLKYILKIITIMGKWIVDFLKKY